jgi:RNA 2',3'-cyclic 3'-phosphodiesterase
VTKRLFIALELPESCRKTLAEMDPGLRGLRWVPAEQMHLTLCFLGEVGAEDEARLREALEQIHVPPFFLPITGVGAFGGVHPSVIWAGVGRGHPHLFALHKRVKDAALQAGLEPDLGPFHPHITIGRAKGISREALLPFLRKYDGEELGMWKVTGFALYSSVLGSGGATYAIEMRREF